MNISKELLETLKCYECDCYLSVSPIMIKENGQNMCGRCYVESNEEKLEKNIAYEALASHMLFPCRYKGKGCKEILPWNRAQYHEEGCEFQSYECPMYPIGSCEWEGLRSELLAHFKKKHPDSIIEHPCFIKPDIKQNSERNFLISAHGFLFLLQTKCSVAAAKLCYCVRFFGYVNLASLFDFTVHMKTSLDELKKTKVVATQENITFEKDNFIEISINSLLGNLGDYSDISFTLTINKILDKFKRMECFYCDTFINSYEIKGDKNYCKNCTVSKEIIKVCQNKDLGCSYSNAPINVRKHEKWLCIYNQVDNQLQNCILCCIEAEKNKTNANKLLDHSNHNDFTSNKVNAVYKTAENSFNIIYDNTIFACYWELKNNILTFKIISNVSKTESQMFSCTLRLYNPSNFNSVKKTLQFNIKSLEFDWIVNIENDCKKPFIEKQFKNTRASIISTESYGLEIEIRRNDKFSNFWFFYDFPNLNKYNFKETPILSWKNMLVISCISYFINFAFSSDVGPLCVFNRPIFVDKEAIRKLLLTD